MNRRSAKVLAALTALPAAVIVTAAISASAPAAPLAVTTHARLADAGSSGTPPADVQLGGCVDDKVQATVTWTAQPGQTYSFTVNNPNGSKVTITPGDPTVDTMSLGLAPSTNFTLTVTINGTDSAPISMATGSC